MILFNKYKLKCSDEVYFPLDAVKLIPSLGKLIKIEKYKNSNYLWVFENGEVLRNRFGAMKYPDITILLREAGLTHVGTLPKKAGFSKWKKKEMVELKIKDGELSFDGTVICDGMNKDITWNNVFFVHVIANFMLKLKQDMEFYIPESKKQAIVLKGKGVLFMFMPCAI